MGKIIPRQKLLAPEKYSLKCPWEYKENETRHIIVHNTANDASADNEITYMINNSKPESYHFAVDDKEVVQGLPLSKGGFSCGNRDGDVHGISIEICYSKSGGERFVKAEKLAAQFIAQLLIERGWGIDRVKKHQDFDGKYCPHRTLDLGWQRFLNMVKSYMEDDMTKEDVLKIIEEHEKAKEKKAASEWAEKAVAYCKENGILNGDENGMMRPQSNITRQEVAAVFFNFLGAGKDPSGYAAAVWEAATAAGIVDGTNPRAPLTREQFVVILSKLGQLPEKN